MKNSDLLIIIDADLTESPFLPSKAVDYAGSGTPILAITPKDSTTKKFLTELGYKSYEHSDIDEISRYIIRAINEGIDERMNLKNLKKYTVGTVVEELLHKMDKVLYEN